MKKTVSHLTSSALFVGLSAINSGTVNAGEMLSPAIPMSSRCPMFARYPVLPRRVALRKGNRIALKKIQGKHI